MLPDLCPDLTRPKSDNNNSQNSIQETRDTSLKRFSRNVVESKEYAMPDELKSDFEFFQEKFRKNRGVKKVSDVGHTCCRQKCHQ